MGLISGRNHAGVLGVLFAAGVVLVLVLTLGLPASAVAKPKKISGTLSAPGYTVIALAKGGEAKTKRGSRRAKFKLRPPAKKVTLHLRASDGTYAGPIVLRKAKKGKRAILGVKAKKKVQLGKVKVSPAKGYAKVKKLSKRQRKTLLDTKRQAKAKKGIPIGAGNFGRVRVKKLKGGCLLYTSPSPRDRS